MPEIISCKEAKAQGLKRYFTGKPCRHGHISKRHVSSYACCDCARGHQRLWEVANKKKVAERQRRWSKENMERKRTVARNWYLENKERLVPQHRVHNNKRHRKIADMIAVLRAEMPELLKEFGL